MRKLLMLCSVLTLSSATLLGAGKTESAAVPFTNVQEQTRKFVEYYKSIQLTPEQEKIKTEALSTIPAPCCSEFSMATCCCPCNLAKSVWGLSAYLITDQGSSVEEVRKAAKDWIAFVNKKGYEGNTCKTGGCNRAFHLSGCGGMKEDNIVF